MSAAKKTNIDAAQVIAKNSVLQKLVPWMRPLIGKVISLFLLIFLLWQGSFIVRILWWRVVPPQETSFMSLRLEKLREKNPNAHLTYVWRDYEAFSPALKKAVVAAEDDGFIDHDGFDWDGIMAALEKDRRKGKFVAGGSTITQQLAKNLFLSGSRSLLRKAQEALITIWLEIFWDKRRILEVYLNIAEWADDGVFGGEAAALHYFGIPAAQLNAEQAARLAVLLPAPRRLGRNIYQERLDNRVQRILRNMRHSEIPP